MLDPNILQRLKELDIRTITQVVNKAQQEKNSLQLTLRVEPPYYFFKADVSKTALNKVIHYKSVVGYIAINGITYLILYYKNPEEVKDWLNNNADKIYKELFINIYQHIKIMHKKKPDTSVTETPTIETFSTSSMFDELQKISAELPNTYYPQGHTYIFLYEHALKCECFNDVNFFKFFCILSLIAQKSNIILQQRDTCHIHLKDLMAIIPPAFKRTPVKPKTTTPQTKPTEHSEKRTYQKAYVRFLDFSCKSGMVDEYALLDNGYIKIVFSKCFHNFFSTPPYIRIPFELVNMITNYNYKFLMYFILREFHNNPKYPCNINMHLKDLLKVADITTHESTKTAADRLNSYLKIMQDYHAIRNDDIDITPNDIKNNKVLKFRLFHFRIFTGELENDLNSEEPTEHTTTHEPTEKYEPSEAFLKANKELEERKNP